MAQRTVFISHSSRDTAWARSFARALKERGVRAWFDEFELQPGEPRQDAIETALRNSDVLVPLVDPESNWKPNLFFELGLAIGTGKRVVPIVPKDLDPEILPVNVRHRLFLIRDTPEQTAEELYTTLQAA